mmetsp:Transcript_108673/g.307331  ORF Transcript_108673/g.307331 Transcript_108673/m.307331 type:complete len:714 (+) Transcript_108673:76-2217(+)
MSWTELATEGARPLTREGHCAEAIQGRVFVFGGRQGTTMLGDLCVLDVASRRWLDVAPGGRRPGGRAFSATAVVGRELVMHGGEGSEGYFGDMHALDASCFPAAGRLSWREVQMKGRLPEHSRRGHSLTQCVGAGGLYLFGGLESVGNKLRYFNAVGADTMQVFDYGEESWKLVTFSGAVPACRAYHTMTAFRARLYLVGGIGRKNKRYDDVHVFDVENQHWSQCEQPMRVKSAGHTATLIRDQIFVFGGFGDTVMNDVQVFDPLHCKWGPPAYHASSSTPPSERSRHSACLIGTERICVFGGCSKEACFNDVHVFDAAGGTLDATLDAGAEQALDATGGSLEATTGAGAAQAAALNAGADEARDTAQNAEQNRHAVEPARRDGAVETTASPGEVVLRADEALPSQRWGHSCEVINNRLYIFGGSEDRKRHLNDLHVYDTTSCVWKEVLTNGNTPSNRGNHATTAVDQQLVLHGGWNSDETLDDMYILDTRGSSGTLAWHSIENRERFARVGHTLSREADGVYMFGGWDGESFLNQVMWTSKDISSSTTASWAPIDCSGTLPEGRAYHTMTAVSSKLYLFGGINKLHRCPADLHIFDTRQLQWSQPSVSGVMPTVRDGHTANLVGDKIFVFGGHDVLGCTRDIYAFDTTEGEWHRPDSQVDMLPHGRRKHSACLADSRYLYVFGGEYRGKPLNDFAAIDVGFSGILRPFSSRG